MSPADTATSLAPFSEATRVNKLDSHTYKVNLNKAFSIGAVPNGGYVGACILAAGKAHLSSKNQPDALTSHFEFPAQTTVGPAIIAVDDVKLGRRQSTLHFTLRQDRLLAHAPWITPSSRRAVLAYATFTDLRTVTGVSQTTGYEVAASSSLPHQPDFAKLRAGDSDSYWRASTLPTGSESWRSLHNWKFYVPCAGPLTPGVLDTWIRTASGERITPNALPYVADSFPYNLHAYLAADKAAQRKALWFPTLTMNLEIKAPLPNDGVDWLSVRITSKQIKNGVFDLDITIRDVNGALVALSHHVAMIVALERNTGKPAL